MEPNPPTEGSQVKINDYPQDIPHDYPLQNQLVDSTGSNTLSIKPEVRDSNSVKNSYQQNADGLSGAPSTDQYKGIQTPRQFGQTYNDGSVPRPPMYPDGGMMPSNDQAHYPQSGAMAVANSTSAAAANTPTLNQLLTQAPAPSKYPPGAGYGDFAMNATNASAATGSSQPIYDGWNTPVSMFNNSMGQMRPGMPSPTRPMVPNSPQVGTLASCGVVKSISISALVFGSFHSHQIESSFVLQAMTFITRLYWF